MLWTSDNSCFFDLKTVEVLFNFALFSSGYWFSGKIAALVTRRHLDIDIPADGLKRMYLRLILLGISLNYVFIKLLLIIVNSCHERNSVADAPFWRSNDEYKGVWRWLKKSNPYFPKLILFHSGIFLLAVKRFGCPLRQKENIMCEKTMLLSSLSFLICPLSKMKISFEYWNEFMIIGLNPDINVS